MNRIWCFLGCLIFALVVLGCEQQNKKMSSQSQLKDSVQEKISNEVWDGEPSDKEALPNFLGDRTSWGAFPESMIGVWEAEVGQFSEWGIKFEPDGSIKKIVHPAAGPVNISEGGVDAGTDEVYYIFVMGPCEARYIPETKMIKVKIIVDYFMMKLPTGELEGRMEDYFEGPVSEDGKTWRANLLSFGWLKGANPPDSNLIEANPVPFVFTKLDLTQLRKESETE